nr:DUF116 domain-containing protein [Desulfurispira natronophila]
MALLPAIFYLCLKLNVRNGFFYFAQRYCVRLYFPLILFLGERLRIDKELLVKELVQYNNKYVIKRHGNTLAPQDLLILLPHCLQVRDCDYRVTTDIGRCVGCGRCSIHHFVRIGKEYGVNICTATGGTLARRIIREQRPRAIVAVACSRDLYSGLSDTFPLPVVGVFNQLHHGPCIDTSVDTSAVEGAVRQLLQKNYV